MDWQIYDITKWHEIMSDNLQQNVSNQQPGNKTFRKSDVVVTFWVIMLIIFWLVLLAWLVDQSNYSDDAGILTMWFFIILEIIFLFKIFWAYMTTITVWENSLIYRKWVLFRHKSEISYIQISSVESSSFLWMWNIEITLLNNDFYKFKHVQNYEEAESLINERVKENRLKVQVV